MFQCADCDKVFDSLKVMKKHHYSIHKVHKDLLLKCQECDKKFQNKQKLADHAATVHPNHKEITKQLNVG